MRQAEYTASPPDRTATGSEAERPHANVLNWIAHFTVYVGVVALVCALGVYFLWRLPLPEDLAQLFKNEAPPKSTVASSPNAKTQLVSSAAVQPSADAAAPETAATTAPAAATTSNADDEVVVAAEAPAEAQPVAADTSPKPAATPEAPAPTPQTEIEQLLIEAQQQMDSRRLTAPASGNALSSYRRILELDPNNVAAKAGVERIAAYYQEVAENSLRQGRPDESLAYIQRGLRATPQSQELNNLRGQAQLLQQQREQEQRQAAQRAEQRQRREAEQALAEQQYQEELHRQQLQVQQRQQQASPAARAWWQEPPTYNQSSGFQSK